ncbi:hypothetical protein DMUE_4666 [Dictyocoela muelleri]|nr:hypothetical protein DMUE_4666 [Dictyocoela muelleri]
MNYPINLQRQVIRHSLGLLIINSMLLKNTINLENTIMTVIGIITSLFFKKSKINYFIGNVIFLASIYYKIPFLYFYSYGLILSVTYMSILRLCLSDFKKENSEICFKLECAGLFLNIFMNDKIVMFMAMLQFLNIYFLFEVPVETYKSDKKRFLSCVYEKITQLLGENSYVLLSREYKTIVEMYYKKQDHRDYRIKYMIFSWNNFLIPLLFINIPFYLKVALIISPLVPNKKYRWCNVVYYALSLVQFYMCAFIFALFCDWNDYVDSYDKKVLNTMVLCRFLACVAIFIILTQCLGFKGVTIMESY